MGDSDRDAIVRQLAKDVVTSGFSDELRNFDETADIYFDKPADALPLSGRRQEPLGSGIEIGIAVAAVVLYLADKAVDFLLPYLVTKGAAKVRTAGWLKRKPQLTITSAAEFPPVGPELEGELRTMLATEAAYAGLPPADARRVADAVLARLKKQGGSA